MSGVKSKTVALCEETFLRKASISEFNENSSIISFASATSATKLFTALMDGSPATVFVMLSASSFARLGLLGQTTYHG